VIDLSLNEVESLALKVARGAGFDWGACEDISRGARALARRGDPWAEALLALARDAGRWGGESVASPVSLAARWIDDPPPLERSGKRVANVGSPIWVSALFAASPIGETIEVEWPGGRLAPVADIVIAPRAPALTALLRRASADTAILAALGEIAARVYVPASAESRAKGAGGGRVDEE
jgi:hypothetical protein